MNPTKHLVILAMIFMVLSCQKDDDQIVEYDHLINATLIRSISEEEMGAVFILAKQFFPEIPDLNHELIGGINVYYLEYTSSYLEGEPIVLSGLVYTPDDASRESMIVSVQNGTLVEYSSAPSKDLDKPSFLLMQLMASLGYVMVIQDYIGFGASEAYPHPYLVKPLFQSTVKDMLLATQEMAASGDYPFQLSGELFLTGYSLGGWASLVTHHYLENNPIDGLKLTGSVCGAGAYNLLDMQEYLIEQTNYRQPYYIALLFFGYISVGAIQDDLSLFFNEPYDLRIPDLMDGEHSPGQINSQLSYNMTELLSQRLLTEFDSHPDFAPLKQALEDNSQQAWVNKAPIHLFHGDADEDIPISVSENLFADFQNMGVGPGRINLVRLEGADHRSGSMPMYLMLLDLLEDGNLETQTKSWATGY